MNTWRKLCCGMGAAAVALSVAGAEPPPVKPWLAEYYDSVVFSLDFDNGTMNPNVSNGVAKPLRIEGTPAFAPGISGSALRIGRAQFDAANLVNLRAEGTLLMWLSPDNWAAAPAPEPTFGWFSANGEASSLSVSHMAHRKWGEGCVNVYYYLWKQKKVVNGQLWHVGSAKDWKNGSWHLLAVGWSPGGWSVSIDGGAVWNFVFPSPPEPTKTFWIGSRVKDVPGDWLTRIDEVAILDVRLNAGQIKAIYEKMAKPAEADREKDTKN